MKIAYTIGDIKKEIEFSVDEFKNENVRMFIELFIGNKDTSDINEETEDLTLDETCDSYNKMAYKRDR